jgi:cation diffusion facilitator CzcD-associated flavoprotein CzcO
MQDILTAILIIVAILTFAANWKSAKASEESAKAARSLYELEQAEYRRREESERPNLQLFNMYIVKREKPTGQIYHLPVNVDMMNFGNRPAKITAARFEISGKTFDADPRTTTCVRRHEIVRFSADRNRLDIREAFIEAEVGVKPALQGGESFLQRAGNPENVSAEYRKVTLTLTYSETDGTGEQTIPFTFGVPTYRGDYSNQAVSMRVLHDAKEAERGDLPE